MGGFRVDPILGEILIKAGPAGSLWQKSVFLGTSEKSKPQIPKLGTTHCGGLRSIVPAGRPIKCLLICRAMEEGSPRDTTLIHLHRNPPQL